MAISGLWFYSDPIDKLHQENLRFLKAQQFSRFVSAEGGERQGMERESLAVIVSHLERAGHYVEEAPPRSPYDLLVDGCLRVECKAANWTERTHGQGGRFKAYLKKRQWTVADLVIFAAKNGAWHHFILPRQAVTSRSIEITTYDVEAYTGQYAPFLEAWDQIEAAVDQVSDRPKQLRLF